MVFDTSANDDYIGVKGFGSILINSLYSSLVFRLHRLLWIIAFSVSLWLCVSMSQNIWIQWQQNPIQLTIAKKTVPISSIPFPTVTICPEIKTIKGRFDISSTLRSLSNLTDKKLGIKEILYKKNSLNLFI